MKDSERGAYHYASAMDIGGHHDSEIRAFFAKNPLPSQNASADSSADIHDDKNASEVTSQTNTLRADKRWIVGQYKLTSTRSLHALFCVLSFDS
jgi:hypothetical protein